MGYYSIVVPHTANLTNLVTNPSIELATTGYTAVGGSVARSTAQSRRGAASLAVTPTAGTTDGVYYGTVSLVSGTTYTFSVDVLGVAGVPYRIYFGSTAAAVLGTPTAFTGTGAWQRVTVTYAETSTTTRRLYVVKSNSNNTGDFYVDGLTCAAIDQEVTYIDGDQAGCEWSGAEHASTSSLDRRSRAGGLVVDLDDYSVTVEDPLGVGMAFSKHKTLAQPLLPGRLYRGGKVQERPLTLKIALSDGTVPELHALRAALIDAIKPDLVPGDQPFILRYSGADRTLDLSCVYDSGLELGQLNYLLEKIDLKLIAYDPYWYEDGESAAQLATSETGLAYVLAKIDGAWSQLGTSPTGGTPLAIARGPDGSIYAAGSFTQIGGVADTAYIARWDGSAWNALGTGMNGTVRVLAIGPDGSLYAGGDFTSAGGVADTTRIAKWDGSDWSALGTGANGSVRALLFDQSGVLYAGGSFTTPSNYIAQWDGSSWSAVGAAGMDDVVYALALGADGAIYLGGDFTDVSGGPGGTYDYIAKWDGSSYSALGSGAGAGVRAIAIAPDGALYTGGDFTTIGGVSANYIASWNGAAWAALGSGTNNGVSGIFVSPDGLVYATGTFTVAGGIALAAKIAVWNGYSWSHSEINTTLAVNDIIFHGDDIYVAISGPPTLPGLNTITNQGSTAAYPRFVFGRSSATPGTSATVALIRNETTGATLYCNYALLPGEELAIDFTPGARKIVSSVFGTVWHALLRNSDFTGFYLLPGQNDISVLVIAVGSPTLTAYALWKNKFWSNDGAAA